MAKPKTQSDPISFRIPLELYPDLEEEAAKIGCTPSERVAMLVINRQRRRLGLEQLPMRGSVGPESTENLDHGYGRWTPNAQRPLEGR